MPRFFLLLVLFTLPSFAPIVNAGEKVKGDSQPGKITMEKVAYKGWANNLKISNGEVEILVTLDVGPRILSYRMVGGKNVFKEYEDQLGKSGETSWMIRGGHRLWTAPEDLTRTYFPDNGPVAFKVLGPGKFRFSPRPEKKYGIQKELEIHVPAKGTKVTVLHRITNIAKKDTKLAIWALSVMAPGGTEIIPLPAKRPHPGPPEQAKSPEDYAADLHMTFWPYFDFRDERCKLGTKFITLRQDPKAKGPIKFGLLHLLGWVGYLNQDVLFIKRVPLQKGAHYPDGGCNYETFTNADMLEMESVGPLAKIAPGKAVEMVETWELIGNARPNGIRFSPTNEAHIEQYILPRIRP